MRIALALLALALSAASATGQAIDNGSLNGPTGFSVLPPGWSHLLPNCDTEDANGPHELYILSPDGGTFVAGANATTQIPVGVEAFEQSVSGFTPGIEYTLLFYQSNLGYGPHNDSGNWGATASWELYLDGEATGLFSAPMQPEIGTLPNNSWSAGDITFTASAVQHAIGFGPRSLDGPNTFLGIDGISIVPAVATAPSTLSTIKSRY